VEADATFSRGQPRMLFESNELGGTVPVRSIDINPDGSRFVGLSQGAQEPEPVTRIDIAQNWIDELKRLVPLD
jgi:hypothetical protein